MFSSSMKTILAIIAIFWPFFLFILFFMYAGAEKIDKDSDLMDEDEKLNFNK